MQNTWLQRWGINIQQADKVMISSQKNKKLITTITIIVFVIASFNILRAFIGQLSYSNLPGL